MLGLSRQHASQGDGTRKKLKFHFVLVMLDWIKKYSTRAKLVKNIYNCKCFQYKSITFVTL
jgi:hypothetical protein